MNEFELVMIEGKKISLEKLKEIEENENVIDVLNLGYSGKYPTHLWYNIIIGNNSHNFEIDVYVK